MWSGCSLSSSPQLDQAVQQFQQDTANLTTYLKQHNIQATTLSSGIRFVIDSLSSGIRPVFSDSISISYTTTLLSTGAVVEQSTAPLKTTVDKLIYGATIAMPQFQAGSKGRIFIPAYYVNNNLGAQSLTSAVMLIFNFKIPVVKDYQLKADTVTIDNFLKTNSIQAFKDVSGVRYTMDTLGTGPIPNVSNYITVNYKAYVLGDPTIVDQATSKHFLLSDLIVGWQAILTRIPEGSYITLYIPSSLAYGNHVQGSIKANANLVFKVKLLKVSSN